MTEGLVDDDAQRGPGEPNKVTCLLLASLECRKEDSPLFHRPFCSTYTTALTIETYTINSSYLPSRTFSDVPTRSVSTARLSVFRRTIKNISNPC